jgi:hypothetical protein
MNYADFRGFRPCHLFLQHKQFLNPMALNGSLEEKSPAMSCPGFFAGNHSNRSFHL